MNGPLKFLTARKILLLLDLLAKFKWVLACSCFPNFYFARKLAKQIFHFCSCSQKIAVLGMLAKTIHHPYYRYLFLPPWWCFFSISLKGVHLTRCVVGLETHPWWGQDYMLISGQVPQVPDTVNRYLRSFYPQRLWTALKRVTRPLRLAQEPSVRWLNWLVVMAVLYAWASLVRSVWRSTQSIWCGRQWRMVS